MSVHDKIPWFDIRQGFYVYNQFYFSNGVNFR
jgi:hypothetical protein